MGVILKRPQSVWDWLQMRILYLRAFPAQERKSFRLIRELNRKGKMDVWRVCRENRFAGLAITINSEDLILLDYLAVSPAARCQGVGSSILDQLQKIYEGRDVFLEIESEYEDVPDRAMRQRRKRFYLRCGLKPMGVMVRLFGVKMELLSWGRKLSYQEYLDFYCTNCAPWMDQDIIEEKYPERV